MDEYDVALWRFWPSLFPEWTERVRAFSEHKAVYDLMRVHGVSFVEKAAVRAYDGSHIRRFYSVSCPREVEVSSDD
jgi:hypothetical protein